MEKERLEIVNEWKVIDAKKACFDYSRFIASGAEHMHFEDVSLVGTKITNANLSNIEIDGVQMGGALFHNIGIPREGDVFYNPDTAGKPIQFENCELVSSKFINCDLSNVEIIDCTLHGIRINGILVEDLLKAYNDSRNSGSE